MHEWAGKALRILSCYYSYYMQVRDEYTGQLKSFHYTDDGFGNLILCDENKERTYRYSYTH